MDRSKDKEKRMEKLTQRDGWTEGRMKGKKWER